MLAIIGSSLSEDVLILLVAFLLFGKRFPEVAGKIGQKLFQFRKGMDDLKLELSRPIREQVEGPLRDAMRSARSSVDEARSGFERAQRSIESTPATTAAAAAASIASPGKSTSPKSGGSPPARRPLAYPGTTSPDATPGSANTSPAAGTPNASEAQRTSGASRADESGQHDASSPS